MRVLVTRSAEDAARTARRLEALGHVCLVAPLMILRPLTFAWPPEPVDAVVVSSSNALVALRSSPANPELPLFAVGERTAAIARAHGFADVRVGSGDATALLATLTAALPRPARLLYLAGVDRKPTLEAGLAARGHALIVRETYAMVPLAALPQTVSDALTDDRLDAVLHYSRRSAEIFCRLVAAAGVSAAAAALAHHCLSADTAAALSAIGTPRIAVAARADEAALLATLSR